VSIERAVLPLLARSGDEGWSVVATVTTIDGRNACLTTATAVTGFAPGWLAVLVDGDICEVVDVHIHDAVDLALLAVDVSGVSIAPAMALSAEFTRPGLPVCAWGYEASFWSGQPPLPRGRFLSGHLQSLGEFDGPLDLPFFGAELSFAVPGGSEGAAVVSVSDPQSVIGLATGNRACTAVGHTQPALLYGLALVLRPLRTWIEGHTATLTRDLP
jgi:hypothetical protein